MTFKGRERIVSASNFGAGSPRFVVVPPCPGDLKSDSLVDDSDFQIIVAAYDLLDCADPTMPPGCALRFNRDGLVDDADFRVVVVAYNELTCP